jgi:glycosyltransferase involved in cell wall biosynthesis
VINPGSDLYGSDRMVLETVRALVGDGYRVVVAVPTDGPLVAEIAARGGETSICPMAVIRKGLLSPSGLLRLSAEAIASLAPSVALIRQVDPSVIYVNTLTPPLWLLLAKLMRRPSICHVHEGESGVSRTLLRAINTPLLLADRLIVNSEFSRRVLVETLPRLARRSMVVYNAVAGPKRVTPPREHLDGSLRLLFVGRLSPRKGPDVAVRALSILRNAGVDAVLDVVGGVFAGYEWFERDLRTLISELGVSDFVHLHGFHADTWPFAADADIVLVPSTVDEPFGNTAVESLLAARPVVVSAIGGLPEATEGFGAAVRVPPADAGAVASSVLHIVDQWDMFRSCAIADAVAAARRFSSDNYEESVLDAVDAVSRPGREGAAISYVGA